MPTRILLAVLAAYCIVSSAGEIIPHDRKYGPNNTRCDILKGTALRRLCTWRVSHELKLKYKDGMTREGTLYTIYNIGEDVDRFMVTFYASALSRCSMAEYLPTNKFICKDKDKLQKPMEMPESEIHCFTFFLHYVEDLLTMCMEKRGIIDARGYHNVYVALHYANQLPKDGQPMQRRIDLVTFVLTSLILHCVARVIEIDW